MCHWVTLLMLILLGTFAIWLGGVTTLVAVVVVSFPVFLHVVQGTTVRSLEPFLLLHIHGNSLFYVPFIKGHVVVDHKVLKLLRQ